ncbi:MAG: phage tail sheath family protein [bacterium]|nr:phage tail sheath family protein [bacterium]
MVVKQVNFAVTRLEKAAKNTDTLYLETLNNIKPGTVLKITSGEKTAEVLVKETNKTAKDNIAILAQPLAGEFPEDAEVKSLEFDLTAIEGENIETFINLSLIREHPRYIENIITDKSSGLIRVEKVENPEPGELNPVPSQAWNWRLEEGANGFPGDVSSYSDINVIYEGKDDLEPDKRTGLYTFKNVDEINIAAIPGITSSYLQKKIIIHCEIDMRDRFGVLDPNPLADLDEIKRQRTFYDSSYAALYYPWVYAFDPLSRSYINMPPSGHVCGVYARTDIERGVHKAPANEKINGIFGLEKLNGKFRIVNKGSQDILNPLGVNCIRQFPGRGIRVWGARTVTSNSLWKYVSVRRLFLYMEESIEKGTQWVVFEPNDAKLWARVIQTITQFLTGVWKDGALMGATPEEAFFIKCDRTTMTQDDIDNGRLICLIGVAPVKPAEFVIFRIAQWQGGSAATE